MRLITLSILASLALPFAGFSNTNELSAADMVAAIKTKQAIAKVMTSFPDAVAACMATNQGRVSLDGGCVALQLSSVDTSKTPRDFQEAWGGFVTTVSSVANSPKARAASFGEILVALQNPNPVAGIGGAVGKAIQGDEAEQRRQEDAVGKVRAAMVQVNLAAARYGVTFH